ncbi:MAG: uroporphyrinogen-III C-methyltransferase [Candidatus Omnitrophota bacterium]|nr:uroporphyrinogen-III C-methyltransferase [Candidatus Omnitrophota bacterium]MDZ4243087.1 uroporphyrinogen-III C-methyltransferase [Candidatus Omnitrophota bacterium]
MNGPSKKLRVGSRGSRLALVQVKEIFDLLKMAGRETAYELKVCDTRGDKDKVTSLTTNPADDFFTDALDQALLSGEIDVAVHSAKDLPKDLRPGLAIYALTEPIDSRDAFVGACKFADLKPGARIGTSSLARQQGIHALNPSLKIVDLRGTIEERLRQIDEGKLDGIIVAACALKRLGLAGRITDILPFDAAPLQGQLAVTGRKGEKDLESVFGLLDVRKKFGTVTLVGAGPGDPELITLKAVAALQQADCVFYDFLVHPSLMEYAPQAEKFFVGKRKGVHTIPQDEISRRLKDKAMAGKVVVRLKGGDPLIFARGAEEIEYLRSFHINVSVVPGITSATGIPSSLGIPLTARGLSTSVAFVRGHSEEEYAPPESLSVPKADTLVFLMGLTRLGLIVRSLLQAGWKEKTPMVIVSKGTRVEERIVHGTLATIESEAAKAQPEPPALMVVGEVVKFWTPGAEKDENILYLGTNPDKYRSLGRVIHHPMIEISAAEMTPGFEKNFRDLDSYDMILFTSRFAVRHFFRILQEKKIAREIVQRKDVAAVGRDTALALVPFGIRPSLVADEETSEGMLKALEKNFALEGKRILFPRSSLPNPYLREGLTRLGSRVDEVTVYRNTKPAKRPLPQVPIQKIVFTSPSTVRNFLEDHGPVPPDWQILGKGPRTLEALKKEGYTNGIVVVE